MRKWRNIFYFKSLHYGVSIVLLALIPVSLAIIFFQTFVNVSPYSKEIKSIAISETYDLQMLIYYIISGLIHVIICFVIASHFSMSNNKDTPYPKLRILKTIRFIFLIFVLALVYILDALHINVAYLSHDRLYILMGKSEYFKSAFIYFPENLSSLFNGWEWFHLFSSFPFMLISIAIAVMIYSGFYIGNELYQFLHVKELSIERIKEYIKDLHLMLRNYAQLLSIALVSSTIATVLFLQVPVPLIKDDAIRANYTNVSVAIGVFWGVVFSLTLLFLCIYPYRLAHKKITALIQMDRVKNDPKLEEWLDKHKNYYTFIWNLKLLTSIISPAAAGILSAVISHIL